MSNTSKADQVKALRLSRAEANTRRPRSKPVKPPHPKPAPKPEPKPEPKRKRAAKGTFDKVAYQRDYMRRRRKAEREAQKK